MADPWQEEMRKALASEDSSLLIPDSAEQPDQCFLRREKSKELLHTLEETHAFSRLYRESHEGKLLQVVRRKAFSPLKGLPFRTIQLRDPHVAPSPRPSLCDSHHSPDLFRYPYWNFLPKHSLKPSPSLSTGVSSHRRTCSTIDRRIAPLQVVLQQVRVKRRVPSIDQLLCSRKDLGLEIGEAEFTKRFRDLWKGKNTVKSTRKGKELTEKREKPPESGKIEGFISEDQRRKRELTDRAKSLFSSGVFSRHHSTERAVRDRELMAWLRYC